MIEENLLIKYQAKIVDFNKGDYLFKKNATARYYYQIQKGEVKLYNCSSDGKEFIQSIYSDNSGIGEAAILANFNYLTEGKVTKDSRIWLLSKSNFLKLIRENNNEFLNVSKTIAEQLYFISMMAYENSTENSEHRILTLLHYLKTEKYNTNEPYKYRVKLSRKEIGELTGLRVETVIRTIKKLEKNNKLKLIKHKVYI